MIANGGRTTKSGDGKAVDEEELEEGKRFFRLRLKHFDDPPHLKNKKKIYSDWMVVRTKNNQELLAKYSLKEQGHEVIAPMLWDDRARPRAIPMFPGYIFVRGDFKHSINNTKGVIGVIMGASAPGRVPLRVMRNLIKSLDLGDDIRDITKNPPQMGDIVAINEGVFKGWRGLYTAKAARGRVRVLLNLLGSGREVELPLSSIESI
jgi:transcription antitermination factor NusG